MATEVISGSYTAYSATHKAPDGNSYGVLFLACGWDEAEAIAARLGLTDVGLLKNIYPADDSVIDWATQRGVPQ